MFKTYRVSTTLVINTASHGQQELAPASDRGRRAPRRATVGRQLAPGHEEVAAGS